MAEWQPARLTAIGQRGAIPFRQARATGRADQAPDARGGGEATGPNAPDVPRHLLPVLRQLLTGATDASASRRLGVSPRTFSRRVSELLDHLGVHSRFQAGVASAQLGLVTTGRAVSRRDAHARRPTPRPPRPLPGGGQNRPLPSRGPAHPGAEGRRNHV